MLHSVRNVSSYEMCYNCMRMTALCCAGGLCSLTIDKALPEDQGQYKCRAEKSTGSAECSCTVLVDGKIVASHTSSPDAACCDTFAVWEYLRSSQVHITGRNRLSPFGFKSCLLPLLKV